MNLYRRLKLPVSLFRAALITAITAISVLAFAPLTSHVGVPGSDKANHFLAFLVLSALLDGSAQESGFDAKKVFCVMLYALFIEMVQAQLPYRDFSWLDLLADALGVAAYAVLLMLSWRILSHWKK